VSVVGRCEGDATPAAARGLPKPSGFGRGRAAETTTGGSVLTSEPLDLQKKLHELRRLQQELQHQQQLRQKTEQEVGELAARVQQMLRTTLDGYLLADVAGRIRDVNPSYCRMIGYTRDELLGMNVWQLQCDGTAEQVQQELREMVVARSARFQTRHRRKDGRLVDLDVSVTVFHSPEDGPLVAAFLRDITSEKRTRRILEAQNAVLRSLASGEPLGEALAKLISHIERLCDGAIGSVLLVHENEQKLVHGAAPGLPADFVRLIDGLSIAPTGSVCGVAAYRNQRVVVRDLLTDPLTSHYAEVAKRFRLRACWSQPIRSADGDVLGTFAFYYREPKEPSSEEIELIETAADLAGLAIERSHYLQALKESEQRFRQLASLTQEGVAVHIDGRIVDANDSFAKMFGYEVSEVVGQDLRRFSPPLPAGQTDNGHHSLAGDTYEGPCVRKDGSTFLAHATGRSIFYHGRPARVLCVRDVTEQKLAERERERLINDLQAKNRELELFTQTVSHDLRGPLVTLKGFLSHLQRDLHTDDPVVQEDLAHMQRAIERMDEMLVDLLRLSQVGQPIGPRQNVPASRLIAETIERLKESIAEAGAQVVVHPGLPTVCGDVSRLVQVFQNLLENAIKFSRRNTPPVVEIRGWQHHDRAVIQVRDNGIGLERHDCERIFQVFEQVESNSPGTGMGLAICRRIVEAHGGRIWAESEGLGRGACFLVELPAAERRG